MIKICNTLSYVKFKNDSNYKKVLDVQKILYERL